MSESKMKRGTYKVTGYVRHRYESVVYIGGGVTEAEAADLLTSEMTFEGESSVMFPDTEYSDCEISLEPCDGAAYTNTHMILNTPAGVRLRSPEEKSIYVLAADDGGILLREIEGLDPGKCLGDGFKEDIRCAAALDLKHAWPRVMSYANPVLIEDYDRLANNLPEALYAIMMSDAFSRDIQDDAVLHLVDIIGGSGLAKMIHNKGRMP